MKMLRSEFGEISEALFLTQGHVYVEDCEARFKGESSGFLYAPSQPRPSPSPRVVSTRLRPSWSWTEERAEMGVSEGPVHLSVGLEHKDDLLPDLLQALD